MYDILINMVIIYSMKRLLITSFEIIYASI
jgi:hypothetical protein